MKKSFIIVFLILSIAIYFYLVWFLYDQKDLMNGFLGAVIGVVATLLLASIAREQLGDLSNTSSADFIMKLKEQFFKKKTRILIELFDNDWIKFFKKNDKSGIHYFGVTENKIRESGLPEELQNILLKRKYYSSYEVDDLLLGHFEDIGILEQKGTLKIDMIYDEFSWYIETIWENYQIKKYIVKQRRDLDDKKIYDKFQCIYTKCKEFD